MLLAAPPIDDINRKRLSVGQLYNRSNSELLIFIEYFEMRGPVIIIDCSKLNDFDLTARFAENFMAFFLIKYAE